MNNLRTIRKFNNKTQDKIAELLGISQSNYAKYENEKLDIPNDILKRLATFFNVTTDFLLGVENSKSSLTIRPVTQIQTDEQQLIEAYRNLTAGQKKGLFQMLEIDQSENKADKKIN